ncbi:MAG TPA: hypothetical protein VGS22_14185 [Thermoanaerobaculia bacterium]|jgi:predicted small integral membrane protein|nr:hypothetical protein [Thermoanaerobaculia bacterium]
MKSPRGFAAAIVFLSALPIAALCEAVLPGGGGEIAIHVMLALGAALMVPAAFDFQTPRWIAWTGSTAATFLAVTFLLQGVSTWTKNKSMMHLAYQVLGQRLEALAGNLFFAWCVAVLFIESRGATKVVGAVALALAVGVRGYAFYLSSLGRSLGAEAPALQVLELLPFVWLVFEAKKKRPRESIG